MGAEPQDLARTFAALGDPTRLAILDRLAASEPVPIARLAEELPISRQAVSKHLSVLERANLVQRVRQGRETRVSLQPQVLVPVRDWVGEVERLWDAALVRLRDRLA